MIDLIKLDGLKGQRPSALLGLALDGSRLDAVVLRRTNGSLQVQQSASITLSLDPLTADSELVGREIRNHLDAAGGRERRCVVGVPLKWALTTQVELPQLPEQDVEGFLQLEAERGFHCDAQTLLVVRSLCRSPSGKQHATLVGIPKNHLALLEAALRAAKLKPVSFSLGIGALQSPGAQVSDGVLALAIGECFTPTSSPERRASHWGNCLRNCAKQSTGSASSGRVTWPSNWPMKSNCAWNRWG